MQKAVATFYETANEKINFCLLILEKRSFSCFLCRYIDMLRYLSSLNCCLLHWKKTRKDYKKGYEMVVKAVNYIRLKGLGNK